MAVYQAHRLIVKANNTSAGTQLLAADRDELAELVERCTVFAKVMPQQKKAIVAALQAAGHIVALEMATTTPLRCARLTSASL